ncbi:MAG TPA: phospholipase D family protein, partial [Burkholderiales bacterium]|nr:phospholipase D family protein [Burkholderiales bacterium]
GVDFPKSRTTALAQPAETRIGRDIAAAGRSHPQQSAFRLLPSGLDGILARIEMADAAEKTIDVQYYIYRQDETAKLLSDALLRAADRGVRVRVLLDDHGAVHKHFILTLDRHPNIEVRIFNPFAYRGESWLLRSLELALHAPRLRYRMHNKLIVADNTIAMVGGRNVGDEYFQVSPKFEFGDYDLIAAGPIAHELSQTFDRFWNGELAIPAAAFDDGEDPQALDRVRAALEQHRRDMKHAGYREKLANGEPLASVIGGRGLIWATAEVVCDSPEKAIAGGPQTTSWLRNEAVVRAAATTDSEYLLVSPYLVPGDDGMDLLLKMRQRNVRVRILTNSLEATDVAAAHAGYARYRTELLQHGIELYEARASVNESGERPTPLAAGSSGRFSLHAKASVFDREKVLIGAMNFDKRSLELNTELGLLVHSRELARQVARQFESIANPANSYVVVLDHDGDYGSEPPRLLWRTKHDGEIVDLETEPVRTPWQRAMVDFLLALPVDVLIGEADYN